MKSSGKRRDVVLMMDDDAETVGLAEPGAGGYLEGLVVAPAVHGLEPELAELAGDEIGGLLQLRETPWRGRATRERPET